MKKVGQCPICKCKNLQIFKTYEFMLPEEVKYDDSTGSVDYVHERLGMLFQKFHKGRNSARFDVTFCTSCGLVFSNPRFSAEEIRIKYQTITELGYGKQRRQIRPALKVDERAERIYSLISRYKELESLRVLDYGGAEGYNLITFIRDNFCYLIDYVEYDRLQGINYLGADVSDLQAEKDFDVILLGHVLEHTPEPVRLLNGLLPHLAEDGLFYVEVPLGCHSEWEQLREPITHVNFFSEESMIKCLNGVGLNVVYLSTAYQWVTHGKMWCINVVASPKTINTVVRFKTTQEQTNNLYYDLRPSVEYYLMRLKRKMSRILERYGLAGSS